MKEIPEELRRGPFTHQQARAAGVSARMLMGKRFVRIHPRVWRAVDHDMTHRDDIEAARLALPDDARLTSLSRFQEAGLDFGPRRPIRFVVARDHHIALDGIFLHRTKRMPPSEHAGVSFAAAFIAYCGISRVIDAIKVGDWMLARGLMTLEEVRGLALAQLWRDGAHEAIWILDHLDGASRSLPESEMRAVLDFAGLPRPVVNVPVDLSEDLVVIGDLVYREWRVVVEYEGTQHQEDRQQYTSDLGRYAVLRSEEVGYVQVTKEKLAHARTLAGEVYRELVRRGYSGPPPEFGERWRLLFMSVSVAVGPRTTRNAAS